MQVLRSGNEGRPDCSLGDHEHNRPCNPFGNVCELGFSGRKYGDGRSRLRYGRDQLPKVPDFDGVVHILWQVAGRVDRPGSVQLALHDSNRLTAIVQQRTAAIPSLNSHRDLIDARVIVDTEGRIDDSVRQLLFSAYHAKVWKPQREYVAPDSDHRICKRDGIRKPVASEGFQECEVVGWISSGDCHWNGSFPINADVYPASLSDHVVRGRHVARRHDPPRSCRKTLGWRRRLFCRFRFNDVEVDRVVVVQKVVFATNGAGHIPEDRATG